MIKKVFKFGGALLGNDKGFKQLSKILVDEEKNNSKIIIVISAFKRTTFNLLNAAKIAEISGETPAIPMINEIFDYHLSLVLDLIKNKNSKREIELFIEQKKNDFSKIIRGIAITKELTLRTKDLILSFGEMLASKIVTVYLSETISNIILLDITEILVTDSNYGAAIPDIPATKSKINEKLIPLLQKNKFIVTQGFIAANSAGEITTMGYESSNLTATILAGLTNSDEFIIWSDTEGIRQADPKLAAKMPKLVKNLSYDFAEKLALNGLKLIHHLTINYLKMFDLSVIYKSGFVPNGEFSVINNLGDSEFNNLSHRFVIWNENLTVYYKSKITQELDFTNFSHLTYFLNNSKNSINISPTNHFYISKDTPISIENELLKCNFQKIEAVFLLTFINFSQEDLLLFLSKNICDKNVTVLEVFTNNLSKTTKIFFKTNNFDFIKKAISILNN